MDKKKVKEELLRYNENRPFISLTELARAMHVGKDNARAIVTGLSYFSCGKRKDFLVEDVARRIADEAVLMSGDPVRKIRGMGELEDRLAQGDSGSEGGGSYDE